nr:alpha-glucosidase C-terminal domain-containing protein [Lachnospiraceae bacterium]
AALGRIRQASHTLSYGDYREAALTNRQYAYTRNTIDNTVIITLNNDDNPARVSFGGIKDGTYTGALSGNKVTVSGGGFSAELPAHSGEVWLPEGEYKNYCKGRKAEPVVTVSLHTDDKKEEIKETPAREAEIKKMPAAGETEKESRKETAAEKKPAGKRSGKKVANGAGAKYGLDEKYDAIDPDDIRTRSDYEAMSIEELQVAILEKMAANGPVNDQMIRTVMENVYPDSLKNWVKSFR